MQWRALAEVGCRALLDCRLTALPAALPSPYLRRTTSATRAGSKRSLCVLPFSPRVTQGGVFCARLLYPCRVGLLPHLPD